MNDKRMILGSMNGCQVSTAVALLAVLVTACVGSEGGAREERDASGSSEAPVGGRAFVDTVSPVAYRIFEVDTLSNSPRRALYRFMALADANREGMAKTLRVALDSIGRSDSSLVAARAILYTIHRTSVSEGRLVPRVWAEWVPPGGWDSVGTQRGRRAYRSYIYHSDPGWASAEAADSTVGER
jgi:hypothetical protein